MASAPSTTASTLAPPPPLRSPLSFSSRRLPFAVALPRTAGPSSALLCRASARLALARARVRCRGAVKLVGEGKFEAEVMQSELPVLVDFVADWCGPCRLVAPVVDWASEEYEGRLKIVKIDHDANPQITSNYRKVQGLRSPGVDPLQEWGGGAREPKRRCDKQGQVQGLH